MEVLKPNGKIIQVKTEQALANVVTIDEMRKYEIEFYHAQQVLAKQGDAYGVSGSPFVKWTIENPDLDAYNKLRITETRDSKITVFDYSYQDIAKAWTLALPEGGHAEVSTSYEEAGLIQRITRRIVAPDGAELSRSVKAYRRFSWGAALIEEIVGNGDEAQKTSLSYYESNLPFTPSGNLIPLKQLIRPDGSWEFYQYDTRGRKAVVYSGLADAAPPENTPPTDDTCRRIVYSYNPSDVAGSTDDVVEKAHIPRKTVEYYLGTVTMKSYFISILGEERRIACLNPDAAWDGEGNMVTRTKFYMTGAEAGSIRSVENPDGTMSFCVYELTATGKRTTITKGRANSEKTVIESGTGTVTEVNAKGHQIYVERFAIFKDDQDRIQRITLSREASPTTDSFGRPTRTEYLDGTWTEAQRFCCGLNSSIDREGVATEYFYDSLGRSTATKKNGIVITNVLNAAGRVVEVKRIGSDNSVMTLNRAGYNEAGELTKSTNALGGVTTYQRQTINGALVTTEVFPDGGTRIESHYRDGTLKSVTGSAVFPVFYEYGVEGGAYYTKEIKGAATGKEWTKTYQDALGRSYRTEFPRRSSDQATPYSQIYFNAQGQPWKERDPDDVISLYKYNSEGNREYTIQALSSVARGLTSYTELCNPTTWNTILAGPDRITQTLETNLAASNPGNGRGVDIRRVDTFRWSDGSGIGKLISRIDLSTDGTKAWSGLWDKESSPGVWTSSTTVYNRAATRRTVSQIAPDESVSQQVYENGRMVSLRTTANGSDLSFVTYGHDSHGRQNTITDSATGTTVYTFNNADLPISVTTPNPGTLGGVPQVTYTYYDVMSRATNVVQPDRTTVTNEFYPSGLLKRSHGSRTYPVAYGYDHAGRMRWMTNWSTAFLSFSARVTSWNYDENRGWLLSKDYPNITNGFPPAPTAAGTAGPQYDYTAGGRLKTRTWLRTIGSTPVRTDYKYGFDDAVENNQHGDLTATAYNDGTPSVTKVYDRFGQTKKVVADATETTLDYDYVGNLLRESYVGGSLAGISVTNGYDHWLRRTNVVAWYGLGPLNWSQYSYEAGNRLHSASEWLTAYIRGVSATYGYLASSRLVGQIAFVNGASQVTTTKKYDKLNRLKGVSTGAGGSVASFSYNYDNANQRIRVTVEDGSYWLYEYDASGQVTSGRKYWSDGSPVSGQQFGYAFDAIGNRTKAQANDRQTSYSANRLNQLNSRTTSTRALDVIGVALSDLGVTVTSPSANNNAAAPYRKGEYFHKALTYPNSSSALWELVTVRGETDKPGYKYLSPSTQSFTYDADGNLSSDGRWNYTWDAENRLLRMVAVNNLDDRGGLPKRLEFKYDWQGRRIAKSVWNEWTGTVGSYLILSNRFVYDGWNLLAEVDTNGTAGRRYLWGLDLSGSMQGAGGVGGLLSVRDSSGAHVVGYDGNGNVAALFGQSGESARYEYGPFGELIRSTGPMNKANPFRFSTKYHDDETDLLYYGCRYYSPDTARWLGRDLLEELGGLNLYSLVANDPISFFDVVGLGAYAEGTTPPANTLPLDSSTWNTEKGLFGEIQAISTRATLTVAGGYVRGFRDAAAHLQHFLLNSGTTYTIRFKGMNDESQDAKKHFIKELNDALAAAERLTEQKSPVQMVTIKEESASNDEGNWLYAVGRYRTWARGSASRNCKKYQLNWSFNFRDNYDWDLNNGLKGGLVTDREMALLHRWGVAREYEMVGEQTVVISWTKGQRFGSGIEISDGGGR